jgi:hypothetical protein
MSVGRLIGISGGSTAATFAPVGPLLARGKREANELGLAKLAIIECICAD